MIMMIGDHRLRLRLILSSTNLKMGERRAVALSALNLELVKLLDLGEGNHDGDT